MTAQVLSLKTPSANALIEQIKAAWDRADEKKVDADEWYVRTGKLLVELKEKVRQEGGRWLPTLKKLGRSQQRASELMELAKAPEPPKALEKQRERVRTAMKKTRAKSPSRYGDLCAPKATPPAGAAQRKIAKEAAVGPVPMNRQINLMTGELSDFLSAWCHSTKEWAEAHRQQLEDERPGEDGWMTGKATLTRSLNVGANQLLQLAQALDGR